ncbi:MAG: hypothetical protein HYS12_07270 [Planctomycetes bacterium]|nr:hypothetical protein [Planctomycetota bacterium]
MAEASDSDYTLGMIIQLPLTGFWGTDDEMSARDNLAEALEVLFQRSGLGAFDGTDCGSGTTNLFTYGIAPANWDRAVEMVLSQLRQRHLSERAIIVKSLPDEPDDGSEKWIVVWPRDFQGRFSLI